MPKRYTIELTQAELRALRTGMSNSYESMDALERLGMYGSPAMVAAADRAVVKLSRAWFGTTPRA